MKLRHILACTKCGRFSRHNAIIGYDRRRGVRWCVDCVHLQIDAQVGA